jgi:hypothetical protein
MNLEIYYTIENLQFSDKLEKEIYDFFKMQITEQGYNLIKFKKYFSNKYYSNIEKDNIKKGICVLNEMSTYLKFKSNNTIWFLYISNGNTISDKNLPIHTNIFLLNRNINIKQCNYLIKEYMYTIPLKQYLVELFTTKNYLNYDKVFKEEKNEN